jgi:dihydroflavonol-4-reductase
MKDVLVTGGTGFIGSNLAIALLGRGCRVRILRRATSDLRAIGDAPVDHRIGEVRGIDSLKAAMEGCDTVFHTAAMVTFEKKLQELQAEVNVRGTRNVVEACLATGVRKLVHTSSVAALGVPPAGQRATEETEFNLPMTIGYKWSKHKAEEEVRKGIGRGLFAVIVNPSVVVGERDIHMHGGQIVRDVKKWRVPAYIDGGMNVVYVGDVVRGHIAAAERGRSGERYILAGENLTHKQVFTRTAELVGGLRPMLKLPLPLLRTAAAVVEHTSKLIGVRPMITRDMIAGAGRSMWYSSEKAQRELGYTITPFDETILAAYRWYKENGFL